jgi:cysteine desulfurase
VDRGYEATFVNVSETGEIMPETISAAIKSNTALVSLIYVNNEIGTISDIHSIADICHQHDISIHSDLTQAVGKKILNVHEMQLDYASCSAHKIYGPKGIGAAFVKADAYGIAPITAFMHGGEQEFGFRCGTLAVHNIVGFGKAAEIAIRDAKQNEDHLLNLDRMLVNGIGEIPYLRLTNPTNNRMPGIVSIIVEKKDFNNERFIKKVSNQLALSTGSACSAGEPSYVIKALGLEEKTSKVLRITINKYTTKDDVKALIYILKNNL